MQFPSVRVSSLVSFIGIRSHIPDTFLISSINSKPKVLDHMALNIFFV